MRQISAVVSSHDQRFKGFWSSSKESEAYGYGRGILLYFTADIDRKYGGQRQLVLCQRSNPQFCKYMGCARTQ